MSLPRFLTFSLLLISLPVRGFGASLLGPDVERERKGVQWGGLPFANYTTDEGLKTGILAQRFDYGPDGERPFESLLTAQISYATLGSKNLYLEYERTGISSLNLRSRTLLYGSTDDRERFYGLGPSSTYLPDLERAGFYFYREDELSLRNSLRKKLDDVPWEVEAGMENSFYLLKPNEEPSLFAQSYGTGLERTYVTQLQAGIISERRDSEFIPSSGSYFAASASLAPGFLGTTRTWARADLDYRHYYPLVDRRWLTLAGQVRYSVGTDDAPLPEKVRLGSAGTLRGLRFNRYLSNHSFSFRPELRCLWFRQAVFGLPMKGGTGLFVDSGRIGDRFGDLFHGENHVAWGISLFGSYFTDDFLGHADFGFSKEGTSLYVGLGHVF